MLQMKVTVTRSPARFPCPCCGFLTLREKPPGTFTVCPVCFWEDDATQFNDPDHTGGANRSSLRHARENYSVFGASDPEFLPNVRQPFPEEFTSGRKR